MLLKEYTLFIGCLYYLCVHFHCYCFNIQYHGGKRERLPSCQYRHFALFYVLYYEHDEATLDCFTPRLHLQDKKGSDFNLAPPSPLFLATTLIEISCQEVIFSNVILAFLDNLKAEISSSINHGGQQRKVANFLFSEYLDLSLQHRLICKYCSMYCLIISRVNLCNSVHCDKRKIKFINYPFLYSR